MQVTMASEIRRTHLSRLAFLTFVLLLCAFTFLPPRSTPLIAMDFLDSMIPILKNRPAPWLTAFDLHAQLPRLMNGLDLQFITFGEFNVATWIFYLLPDYYDVAVFYVLMIVTLFLTTFSILDIVVAADIRNRGVLIGTAAAYVAFLPINGHLISTVVGLNLTILGLHRAVRGSNTTIVYLLLAPLFGVAPYGPIFYIPILFLMVLTLVRGQALIRAVIYLFLSGILTVLVDYRLFIGQMFKSDQTSRDLLLAGRHFDWAQLIDLGRWNNFINAVYRELFGSDTWFGHQITTLVIAELFVAIALGALLLRLMLNWPIPQISQTVGRLVLSLLGLVIAFAAYNFFLYVPDFYALIGTILHIRTVIFEPILSGLILVFSMTLLSKTVNAAIAPVCVIALSLGIEANAAATRLKAENVVHYTRYGWENPNVSSPRYATLELFYETPLFDAAKESLGPTWHQEKVVSIGIDPMVAYFNGFATLDGYMQNYPASYKYAFRRIIADALEKSPVARAAFDDWGQRVYIPITKYTDQQHIVLHIDACAFTQLGGTLVLSRLPLDNPNESKLEFFKEIYFKGAKLYLYRPREQPCSKDPYGIVPQSADYGTNCIRAAANDVLWHVRRVCEGRRQCEYRVDYTRIGDPAPGCMKDFHVVWTCHQNTKRMSAALPPEASGRTVLLSCN